VTEPARTSVAREAERGIRYGLLAVLVVGLRRRHPGAVVNALGALAASYLPAVIESRYDVEFEPWQRLYASSATFTHAVGMLGPYDDIWWWDHLTHTHSATILASAIYTHARNRGRQPHTRVIAAITTVGVLWEFAEYVIHFFARLLDLEPLLVNYGAQDTLLDLCFNLLGALLVLLFGDRVLENFLGATE
jgi:hypothetical protein